VTETATSNVSHDRLLGLGPGGAVRLRRSGITFSGRLSLERWEELGQRLLALGDSVSWWIADWLVYGEDRFKDRYEEATRRTGLSYQTLRNYAWVARRFDLSRRRDTLSFGHHAEVAALGVVEQEYWLRRAQEFGWTRNRLRAEVRSSQRGEETGPVGGSGQVAVDGRSPTDRDDDAGPMEQYDREELRLHFTSDQLAACQAAANAARLTLDAWASTALIRVAARQTEARPGTAG
jgi:hypothetical protein